MRENTELKTKAQDRKSYRAGWLEDDSKHSIERAKQRAGLNKKRASRMMKLARTRGITSDECTWSLDKSFLASKTNEEAIAVAYDGFCFILDRYTRNCITMFKLPKRFGQKKTFYNENSKKIVYMCENAYCEA